MLLIAVAEWLFAVAFVQTVLKVDSGLVQLKKAQEHQNSSRPMKCMILLVVLIVIMLIVLFVRKL
jgi:hypothetical protein